MLRMLKVIFVLAFGRASHQVRNPGLLMLALRQSGRPFAARRIRRRLERKVGVYVAQTATISRKATFKRPVGLVIGSPVDRASRASKD